MKLRTLRHRNSSQKHARAKIRSFFNKRGISKIAPKNYEELLAQTEQFLASLTVS